MDAKLSVVDQPDGSCPRPTPLCAICAHVEARYTCPRCHTHTCSLSCSRSHKADGACSGARDKAKYVQMNEYGWGTMMDDYVYLEQLTRQVEGWGREIAEGGWARTRGGGAKRIATRRSSSKRETLKQRLELMDIEMELLPKGMQRARENTSTWDFKTNTARLTIEFKFHRPNSFEGSAFSLLTHRNSLSNSLLDLLRVHTEERSGRKRNASNTIPEWAKDLIPSSGHGDADLIPQCLVRASSDPLLPKGIPYHELDPTQPLASSLRNTSFVEYPTVEIWNTGDFTGMVVDRQGRVTQVAKEGRASKRRKLDDKTGRSALGALLGEYRSDGEEDAMGHLADYASEGDENGEAELAHDNEDESESEGPEDETEAALRMEPEELLELLHQVQRSQGDQADWIRSDAEESE